LNTKLLVVENLEVSYEKLKALFGVSIEINRGEVLAIVGRNGMGKSTLFRAIAGFLKEDSGSIVFNGKDIRGMKAYQVARLGLKYIPQDKQVFSDLKVRENLELGSYATKDYDWDTALKYFPKLKDILDRKSGSLSGGERQMLLIARALLGKPELILMDEPTEGLAPHVISELTYAFKEISKYITLAIIEQNLPMVGEIADQVYCMKEGKISNKITDKQEIRDLGFERFL